MFELNRSMFYKATFNDSSNTNLNEKQKSDILNYWKGYFQQSPVSEYKHAWEWIFSQTPACNTPEIPYTNIQEFQDTLKWTRNWSSPGPYQIYNFYFKYITNSQPHLTRQINFFFKGGEEYEELYNSRTILIPKKDNPEPNEYRPIALLNNILKIITKIINSKMKTTPKVCNFISSNQGAFLNPTLGAKELILMDEVIMKNNPSLHTIWLDVSKSFDSIDHNYLFRLLEVLPIHKHLTETIRRIYKNTNTNLQFSATNTLTA